MGGVEPGMLSNNLLFRKNEMRQKKKTQRVCLMSVIQQSWYIPETELGVEQTKIDHMVPFTEVAKKIQEETDCIFL